MQDKASLQWWGEYVDEEDGQASGVVWPGIPELSLPQATNTLQELGPRDGTGLKLLIVYKNPTLSFQWRIFL